MISQKKWWKKTKPIANKSLPTRPIANLINRRQIEIYKRPFDGQMKGIKNGKSIAYEERAQAKLDYTHRLENRSAIEAAKHGEK